jgi:hypothetical protein
LSPKRRCLEASACLELSEAAPSAPWRQHRQPLRADASLSPALVSGARALTSAPTWTPQEFGLSNQEGMR